MSSIKGDQPSIPYAEGSDKPIKGEFKLYERIPMKDNETVFMRELSTSEIGKLLTNSTFTKKLGATDLANINEYLKSKADTKITAKNLTKSVQYGKGAAETIVRIALSAGKALGLGEAGKAQKALTALEGLTQSMQSIPTESVDSAIVRDQHSIHDNIQNHNNLQKCYNEGFQPKANKACLDRYASSLELISDQKTAQVFYNKTQQTQHDAGQVATRREPTNIGNQQSYNKKKLNENFGFEDGVFNDPNLKKEDETSFKEQPNAISIYSQTRAWTTPGDPKSEIPIACFSGWAPALDNPSQPHFDLFVTTTPVEGRPPQRTLNTEAYRDSMKELFKSGILSTTLNKGSAFHGKGFSEELISEIGQGAFLGQLPKEQRDLATKIFYEELVAAIKEGGHKEIPYNIFVHKNPMDPPNKNAAKTAYIQKHFIEPLKEEGFNVGFKEGTLAGVLQPRAKVWNAWDPHSAFGNGNDGDKSFDGEMGKLTGGILTQSPLVNTPLKVKKDEHNPAYIDTSV